MKKNNLINESGILKLGTPKTLDEAVINAICFRPPEGVSIDKYVRAVFRDYLAQKFSVAIFKCETDKENEIIENLWKAITGEDLKKKAG